MLYSTSGPLLRLQFRIVIESAHIDLLNSKETEITDIGDYLCSFLLLLLLFA